MRFPEDILTGHGLIDGQHRRIWEEVQGLRAAPGSSIGTFLDFFPDHAASHFALEEQLMREHGYPLAYDHERRHTEFFDTFVHLRAKYLQSCGHPELVGFVNAMSGWLVEHVDGYDRELAKWIREHPAEPGRMALPG